MNNSTYSIKMNSYAESIKFHLDVDGVQYIIIAA
jgi:hypothetical protein